MRFSDAKTSLDLSRSLMADFSPSKGRAWRRAVDQRVYITQLNIKHYRTKLITESDPAKRETLQRLLAEEKAKLAALNDPPGEQKPKA